MAWRDDLLQEIGQLRGDISTKMNELDTKKEEVSRKKQDLTSVSADDYPSVPAVKAGLDALEADVNAYTDGQVANYIPLTQKGSAGGVAELDTNGTVPAAQLPSYVDDIIEGTVTGTPTNGNYPGFNDETGTPVVGEGGKIYVDTTSGINYRWSGTLFAEISSSLALGETSTTAYRGDRGKTAYDHSQMITGNPHNVTKGQVGLGNANNTSDADKPVSAAQAAAIAVVQNDLNTYKNAAGVPDWSAQFLAALNF